MPMTTIRPSSGEHVDVAGEVLGADVVEHDVGAAAAGLLAQLGDEVLVAVVDGDVSTEFAAACPACSAPPAVTAIRQPGRSARTSWIAMVPMPDEPP